MTKGKTQTKQYWVDDFKIEQSDIDHLYSVLLEQETPLTGEEMAFILVRNRVQQEASLPRAAQSAANRYNPTDQYKVGEKLSFPSMGFATGVVVDTRAGNNPDYGEYTVLQVQFEGDRTLEFASSLAAEHLELTPEEPEVEDTAPLSPEELFIEFGGHVSSAIEAALEDHEDLVRLAGHWFPKSLLANINSGHLNLAEAVLDMYTGGPLGTHQIIEDASMLQNVGEELAEFSLNYALQRDPRFDEVGPAGQVLWYLTRLEPPEVQKPPPRLAYTPISSDPTLLTAELRDLEAEIGDEHSDLPPPRGGQPQSVTITLIYPHLRSGTLPLSPTLSSMFPTAFEAPRIRFTLIDGASGDEYPAWVVRPGGYVYGVGAFFEQYDIPVGSSLTIKRTADPGKVQISAAIRKPRKEWVRTARVEGNRLTFQSLQRPISADYDDLMIIDVPDPDAVDALWRRVEERRTALEQTMSDVLRELATSSAQGSVHAKTIYSAVNLIMRTPPGPIFARLVALPEFVHVGGPYWRLGERSPGD